MKNALRRILSFRLTPITFPAFLLALCLAAYSPFLTRLGFYWDDFPINWIATTMGPAGLARYFSTNRPVWGLIYQVTTPLLGSRPLTWQIFALLMRWISGLALWGLLRLVWEKRIAAENASEYDTRSANGRAVFAAWAAILFVLYPGFSQQFIAFLYSHFFIVLTVFLLSLSLMVLALRQNQTSAHPTRWFWLLTAASLALSLLNLLSMEYFFLLDLLRPLFIWVVFGDSIPNRLSRFKRTLLAWLPYLILFAGAMYWRSVLFGFHTYQPALMSRIKAQPVQAIMDLVPVVLRDLWNVSAAAWVKAFSLPVLLDIGARNVQRYWLFVIAGALLAAVYLIFYRPGKTTAKTNWMQSWLAGQSWAWQPVVIGALALLVAGGPFWLTDLQIGLVFPNDRFTLPFMLGISLLVAGLLQLFPLPRWSKAVLLGITLGFAIGIQFQYAVDYTRDWSTQRTMFWQMVWRMPDLQPGTVLLSNELPVTHYTDNSLTAPLNWTYDPGNSPLEMQYALFYPTLRKEETLSNFQKNSPIYLDYLAATFQGNTSKMVALYFNPPGCVRVLDPEVDIYNWMVPLYLRESLAISTTAPILPLPQNGKKAPRPPALIYGSEIQHGWCYYFEKADLARQFSDWQAVAEIGNQAFSINDYPNDPLERFPFIEGYAHTGNWQRATELTHDSYAVSPLVMQPMMCKLWERIDRQTAATPEKTKTVRAIQSELNCGQETGAK